MPSPKPLYPRPRSKTSAPPAVSEVPALLQEHWGLRPLRVQQARSRRVHFVELPDRSAVFRANPGWDGPTPPETIVEFVHHLARSGAPAPQIIPTATGQLCVRAGDQVLSLESKLPGDAMSGNPLRFLDRVGRALAALHIAAESFPPCRGTSLPLGDYLHPLFRISRSRLEQRAEQRAVDRLYTSIEKEYDRLLSVETPWILCRGDVASINTLATDKGHISFVDFDSALYAPALLDLAMTRFQWRMGTHQGLLDLSSAAQIARGYRAVRPLRREEIRAFPLVWSAYYVDRLSFLHEKWPADSPNRAIWPVAEMLGRAPAEAVAMGRALVDLREI